MESTPDRRRTVGPAACHSGRVYAVCLPYEAAYSLDAILRTLWRMAVTRRHLLEWSRPGRRTPRLRRFARIDVDCPAIADRAGVALAILRPAALIPAAAVLALWLTSPAVAWWMGRPLTPVGAKLTADQPFSSQGCAKDMVVL